MSSISITPPKGTIVMFSVEDKSEAIREVARRMVGLFSKKSVEDALNMWLKSGMRNDLRLGTGSDVVVLKYMP